MECRRESLYSSIAALERSYSGKNVLVTGHTGFKGAWLTTWLLKLGAKVCGYSLPPTTGRSLYGSLGLSGEVEEFFDDVRDLQAMQDCLHAFQPDIVFHFAGVSTIQNSFADPAKTLEINLGGLKNLLSAADASQVLGAIVCVTSDKCYRPSPLPHREEDELRFDDPYAASKSAMEIAVDAYRSKSSSPLVATARTGNSIGGGDWIPGRLMPDVVRACMEVEELRLRNPEAIRPWQHVLDALCGYLSLGRFLLDGIVKMAKPYNFGPGITQHRTVLEIVEASAFYLNKSVNVTYQPEMRGPVEDSCLIIDSSRAAEDLNWQPVWSIHRAVAETASWYLQSYTNEHRALMGATISQIESFMRPAG